MNSTNSLKPNCLQSRFNQARQFLIIFSALQLFLLRNIFASEETQAGINYYEWLSIYGDIFQKLAFLLLAAYFLIKSKPFYRVITHRSEDIAKKDLWISSGILTGLGILTSVIGFLKAGEVDWAFMDLQLILTAIIGLTGGMFFGSVAGLLGSVVKYALTQKLYPYSVILVGAGLIAGAIDHFKWFGFFTRRSAIVCGILIGLLHGLLTYQPLVGEVSGSIIVFGVIVLVILETLCLYAFVAFTLGFLGDERRKRLEKLLPEMKLKFLQAQINPHFLFNALNTIAAICSREKAEGARELIVKLSNYFRRIVKREDEWVSLREELEHVQNYLEIEKARYQSNLQVKTHYQLSPKGAYTQIPILIIQPLVENAIKHGLAPKSGGGTLEICASENGKMVEIIIKDDGVGISPEKLLELQVVTDVKKSSRDDKNEGAGIGLQNIKERLKYQFGTDHKFYIESKENIGTEVHLQLPIEHEREE